MMNSKVVRNAEVMKGKTVQTDDDKNVSVDSSLISIRPEVFMAEDLTVQTQK